MVWSSSASTPKSVTEEHRRRVFVAFAAEQQSRSAAAGLTKAHRAYTCTPQWDFVVVFHVCFIFSTRWLLFMLTALGIWDYEMDSTKKTQKHLSRNDIFKRQTVKKKIEQRWRQRGNFAAPQALHLFPSTQSVFFHHNRPNSSFNPLSCSIVFQSPATSATLLGFRLFLQDSWHAGQVQCSVCWWQAS